MSDERTRAYFTRSAVAFDALYAHEQIFPGQRWINRTFRADIYERFLMTLEHAQAHNITTILDVGCGSGRYAVALAEQGAKRVVGVDFSPSMIELARTHARAASAASACEFINADIMAIDTEERFDLAASPWASSTTSSTPPCC
ncbi:MAG TPA: class I SAM-dependent methyltransferase [Aestuariivirgaceae bacterium]|nr:class I SAM-dependent methyltransferase [Aestuariivirgaceae bacterium]